MSGRCIDIYLYNRDEEVTRRKKKLDALSCLLNSAADANYIVKNISSSLLHIFLIHVFCLLS